MRGPTRDSRRKRLLWVTAAALPILLATLPASNPGDPSAFSRCLLCGETGSADAARNLALFLPLGAALAAAGANVLRATLLGALLSACIECAQLFIPGRDASLGDVLFNGAGTAVAAIGWLSSQRWWPRSSPASWIAWIVACGAFGSTAILLMPTVPSEVLYAQWAPRLGHLEFYSATVLDARIGNIHIPSTRLAESRGLWLLLREGTDIRVSAIAGPPVTRLAALLRIVDAQQRDIVLLGPDGDDLVYQYRTRGTDLRFETPALRVPRAFAGVQAGDTLHVSAGRSDAGICIALNDVSRCPTRFSIADGWALLAYPRLARTRLGPFLGVVWIAGLCFAIAFWSPDRRTIGIQALGIAVVMFAINATSSVAGASVAEFAVAFAALAAGAIARPIRA